MVKVYVPATKTTVFPAPTAFSCLRYVKQIIHVHGVDIISIMISIVVFSKVLDYIFPVDEGTAAELNVFRARIIPLDDLPSSEEENAEKKTLEMETQMNWKQMSEIREYLKQQPNTVLEEICNSDVCYQVYDSSTEINYEPIVQRHLVQRKNRKEVSVGIAELQIPEDLSWANVNTSAWSVHTLVIVAPHVKAMMASAFFTEALMIENVSSNQKLLILGSGTGATAALLVQLDDLMLKITEVEPRKEVIELSAKWFSHTSTVQNENVTTFVADEAKRGSKYSCVFVDSCMYGECSSENIFKLRDNLSSIVEKTGVVIFYTQISNNQILLKSFQRHFESCFLFNYNLELKNEILVCSHRQNWTWEEQRQLFKENLRKIDDVLDFRLMKNFEEI